MAILAKTSFCRCQSMKLAAETENWVIPGKLLAGGTCHTCTSRAGSWNGSGRRSTAFTTLKMAVFAPMPRARTMMAAAVKPGFLRSTRRPCLRSGRRLSMRSSTSGPINAEWAGNVSSFRGGENAYAQLFKAGRGSGGEAVPGDGLQLPAVEGCQCGEIFVAELEA